MCLQFAELVPSVRSEQGTHNPSPSLKRMKEEEEEEEEEEEGGASVTPLAVAPQGILSLLFAIKNKQQEEGNKLKNKKNLENTKKIPQSNTYALWAVGG